MSRGVARFPGGGMNRPGGPVGRPSRPAGLPPNAIGRAGVSVPGNTVRPPGGMGPGNRPGIDQGGGAIANRPGVGGQGTGAYAERILSTPGHTDGLFLACERGRAAEPTGPACRSGARRGLSGAATRPESSSRITATSSACSGPGIRRAGWREGLSAGRTIDRRLRLPGMAGGLWSSGIVTFQVNQDGVVFQKNLGPNTARVAAAWTRFDPDLTWARIDISD